MGLTFVLLSRSNSRPNNKRNLINTAQNPNPQVSFSGERRDWEKGGGEISLSFFLSKRTCHDVHSNYSGSGSIPQRAPCAS